MQTADDVLRTIVSLQSERVDCSRARLLVIHINP